MERRLRPALGSWCRKSKLSISPNTKKNASLNKQAFRGCGRVPESDKLVAGESMTDNQKNQPTNDVHPGDITRRDFAALLVGATLAATVQSAAAAGLARADTDAQTKTQ